ncbi:hypothetical protein V7182_15185, partial [Neobacillus drentensis]
MKIVLLVICAIFAWFCADIRWFCAFFKGFCAVFDAFCTFNHIMDIFPNNLTKMKKTTHKDCLFSFAWQ